MVQLVYFLTRILYRYLTDDARTTEVDCSNLQYVGKCRPQLNYKKHKPTPWSNLLQQGPWPSTALDNTAQQSIP